MPELQAYVFITFGFLPDGQSLGEKPNNALSLETVFIPTTEFNHFISDLVGHDLFDDCVLTLLDGKTYQKNTIFAFIRFFNYEAPTTQPLLKVEDDDLFSSSLGRGEILKC